MRFLKASTELPHRERNYLVIYHGEHFIASFVKDKKGFMTKEGQFMSAYEPEVYYFDMKR